MVADFEMESTEGNFAVKNFEWDMHKEHAHNY